MTDRLNPVPVLRGHWKALRHRDGRSSRPDLIARVVDIGLPLAVGGLAWWRDAHLHSPGLVLSAVALLAAGMLGTFGQLAGLRQRYTDRADEYLDAERPERRQLDETVAHLLTLALACPATGVVIVAAMVNTPPKHEVNAIWTGAICGLGIWLVVLFFLIVPRLYDAYDMAHKVSAGLSGTHTP